MGTFDTLISFANTLQKAGKIPEYTQIMELLEDRFKFLDQINSLREENQNLKDKLRNKEEVKKGTNCYLGKDGAKYCMRCFEKNRELISLKIIRSDSRTECPECKNHFNTDGSETIAHVYHPRMNTYE